MRSSKLGLSVAVVWVASALAGGCADQMVREGPSPSECGATAVDTPTAFDPACTPGDAGASFLGSAGPPAGPRPNFLPTVTASVPPPPISGGTLLVTNDGNTAVAADPDRDALYVVDLAGMTVRSTIALKAGDEPGRVVEDGEGRVHVALRGGGALVTIDPATGSVLARRAVCPAPRGVAWDPATDSVWVACATGELVELPSGGGAATRSLHVERDLRDVIIQDGTLSVTSFRSAQVLRVSSSGLVTRHDSLALPGGDATVTPQVVWRAVSGPLGSILTVHQEESTLSIATQTPGGYGGGGGIGGFAGGALFDDAGPVPPLVPLEVAADAGELFEGDAGALLPLPSFGSSSIVTSVLTAVDVAGTVLFEHPLAGVLPVDIALSRDCSVVTPTCTVAGVTPGNAFTAGLSNFYVVSAGGNGQETDMSLGTNVQPIAVAFDASGRVVVQSRDPAMLWTVPLSGGNIASLQLSAGSRDDTGHDVFHTQAGAQIACASCHPEGGDDGHVWILDGDQRRTPSLRGTIAGTAPYHWPGDQPDLPTLVNNVYTLRMSGALLPPDQMGALTGWVQTIPAPPAPTWVDQNAASLGRVLFERDDTKCATCHTGLKLTNNATVDVGTGGAFQVPPLVGVGWRTPLLHDGCATTIADRFGSCSTPGHGDISSLSAQDKANLSAFLETL